MMAGKYHLRVFNGYGTAVLTLICFAFIVGAIDQSLSGLAEKGYHSGNQMGPYSQGDHQSMDDHMGHSHHGHMGHSSSGGQGSYHGSSGI